MTGESLIRATLTSFLEKLKLDAWFTEHGVRLLMENQMDLLGQIEEVLASSTGLALIVKAPEAENNRSAFTLTLELLALETPSSTALAPKPLPHSKRFGTPPSPSMAQTPCSGASSTPKTRRAGFSKPAPPSPP